MHGLRLLAFCPAGRLARAALQRLGPSPRRRPSALLHELDPRKHYEDALASLLSRLVSHLVATPLAPSLRNSQVGGTSLVGPRARDLPRG